MRMCCSTVMSCCESFFMFVLYVLLTPQLCFLIPSMPCLCSSRPGFDMHFDIEIPLENAFKEINHGLKTFKDAMVAQNKWDDVTVVLVSEFARTLMGNTGNGSDHGK